MKLEWRDVVSSSDFELEAGMVVYAEGEYFLVGDVNEQGGVCDDCRGFARNAVERFAWAIPELASGVDRFVTVSAAPECPPGRP